jgi:hypothetical protein
MKKKLTFICFLLTLSFTGLTQVATGFNFQGVARDSNGELIGDKGVDVVVGIRSGSESGTLVWKEEHTATTNEFGLFTLKVCGDNGLRTGGSASNLEGIDWASDNHFIELQIDAGQGLQDMGASQLLSVPYSMVTSNYPSTVSEMSVQPESTVEPGEALFMVRRGDGYPVFAVYEDGVWVYTDENRTGKGLKGGFAVGGYNAEKKGPGSEYFMVSPDSARVYVNSYDGKGLKGGFAVGGYNASGKGAVDEFMRVTRDSTRIYVNTNPKKGLKGGFAVGGYNQNKAGEDESFMTLTRDNYFIGHNSGAYATGLYNSVLGYESGLNITTGESNAFLGYQAGYLNDVGSGNLFLGYQSGYINTFGDYNTFLGYQAGHLNWGGTNNTFLGSFSGHNNEGGSYNTFVGDSAGYHSNYGGFNTFLGTKAGLSTTNGHSNVFLGNSAGSSNEIGSENVYIGRNSGYSGANTGRNVFIGTEAGFSHKDDWDNIFIGTFSGYSNIEGAGNVFLGYESGKFNEKGTRNVFLGNTAGYNEQGSNKLYISNTDVDSSKALIWGDFAAGALRFNSTVGIGMAPKQVPLSIYHSWSAGVLSLYGAGNGYDYSGIRLNADTTGTNGYYNMSHTLSSSYFLSYVKDEIVHPRLVFDDAGKLGINTLPGDASMTVLNDYGVSNLVLKGIGNELDYASVILESVGQTESTNYSLTHSKEGKFFIGHWDGSNYLPRLKIEPNGFVSINSWDIPSEMLDVAGNARFRGVPTGAGDDLMITEDGTLKRSASDARLKSDFQPLLNSLEKVMQMDGYTFTWKDDEEQNRDAGLVAQDIAEIFPEAVFVNQNDGYYGINYSRFPALFVEAFKDQQSIIEDQNKEISSQQEEIDELKNRLDNLEMLIQEK